ncbi:hypothetical protein MZD04_gp135 [Pseudomonas phage Psa21]|uniref:Uncharacterized protein n=1 Tax=Pseudomonas phage Psa21 TaxID=2530023 RepID=A0A481W4T3_9CAUD|nr:hypothetical protein MZD04_gp135 [Pseudomonas phage Psa21]QBJ02662.1 hypothetical protein PSA21_135 [Pseudomonas phage Psa21]
MSLLGTLIKVGVVATVVVISQRLWDRYQVEDLYTELDALVERIRNRKDRMGTVRAHLLVESKDLIAQYEKKVNYVDSLNELRRNVEIYIESIPD